VLERRRLLRPPGAPPLDAKEHARAARLLHGRGFSEDVITSLLGEGALDPLGPDD
jgi:regulatory protein